MPELKTLLADILLYGAEGQKVMDYHTEHLATEELKAERLTLAATYVKPTAGEVPAFGNMHIEFLPGPAGTCPFVTKKSTDKCSQFTFSTCIHVWKSVIMNH